jgi:predicted ribosome quality control (RQC) complex YloA/Tae2 family protein
MKTQEVLISKIGEIILYKIGTNAQENWDLIDESSEGDLWFHVNDLPSCHVVTSLPNP